MNRLLTSSILLVFVSGGLLANTLNVGQVVIGQAKDFTEVYKKPFENCQDIFSGQCEKINFNIGA